MKHFTQLQGLVDVAALSLAIQTQPDIWNVHGGRREYSTSPHRDCDDIWLRYNALENLKDDYVAWTKEHDSSWHPAARRLPQIRPIVFDLMRRCEATRLGGILITRIPAGKRVFSHADTGWHPRYYNVKLYVPIRANPQCVNRVEDESVVMNTGEIWYMDNTKEHEVVNDGETERMTLIICMKVEHDA